MTHLINLLLVPVLVVLPLEVRSLLLLVPLRPELFFAASVEITRPPLVDAVTRDIAVATASTANDVLMI